MKVYRAVISFTVACLLMLWLIACGQTPASPARTKRQLVLFAAASTADAMSDAATAFEKTTGVHVASSFGASSTLAKQILAGAHADVFLSADERWMDELASNKAIDPTTRRDLLAGELVLIAPKGHTFEATFSTGFAFVERLPNVRRIGVADPEHVPAGLYTKEALAKLGWWTTIKPLIIPAADVRAALRLVEMGEVDAAFVYATDARASSQVELVATMPESLHEAIRYPLAACVNASPDALAFLAFLRDQKNVEIFTARGFTIPRDTIPAP